MKMLGTKSVWYLARGSIIDSGWYSIESLVQISVYDLVRTEVRNSVRSSVLTLVKSFTKESIYENA